MSIDPNEPEPITQGDCIRLLGSAAIGRLALSIHALPVVLPCSFGLALDGIVIRTGGGPEFDQACDQAVVAFEVDGFDPILETGWTVLVQGLATVLTGPLELDVASQLELAPWGDPPGESFVRVPLDLVTGRRLGHWYGLAACPRRLPSWRRARGRRFNRSRPGFP